MNRKVKFGEAESKDDGVQIVTPPPKEQIKIDLTKDPEEASKEEVSEIFSLIFKELNTDKYSITSNKDVSRDQNNNVIEETLVRTLIKLR